MKAVILTLGTTLGVSTLGVALTPVALAQSMPLQLSQAGATTLSGDSLRTVESRTVDSDYQEFIGSPEMQGVSEGTADAQGDEFRLKLNSDLDIITSPPDTQRQADPRPVRPNDNGSDSSVQVQLGL